MLVTACSASSSVPQGTFNGIIPWCLGTFQLFPAVWVCWRENSDEACEISWLLALAHLTPPVIQHIYGTWPIYNGFLYERWRFPCEFTMSLFSSFFWLLSWFRRPKMHRHHPHLVGFAAHVSNHFHPELQFHDRSPDGPPRAERWELGPRKKTWTIRGAAGKTCLEHVSCPYINT